MIMESFQGRSEVWCKIDLEKQLHPLNGLNFLVYSYVSDINRVFLITSSYILVNNTEYDVIVNFYNDELEWTSKPLIKGEKHSIPVEIINDST